MQTNQYSLLQMSFVMMLSVGLMNHVLIIPILMDVSARDAWLSIFLATILFIPFFLMLAYITRKTNQSNLYGWLTTHYGKWLAISIAIVISIVLVSTIIVTTRDFMIWTNSTYLNQTPALVIVGIFLIAALYSAIRGIKAVVITSGILLPIVFFLGEFVMLANLPNKDYSLLFPVFEYGFKQTWNGVIYVGAGFVELILLLFLQQYVSTKIKKRHMIFLGLVMAGLTLGPTMGGLAAFGPTEAALQRSPAFEQWRIVRLGAFINHVDFLSIFQWVSGAYIRVALALLIVMELVTWRRKLVVTVVTIICGLTTLYPIGDIYVLKFLKHTYYPAVLISLLSMTVLLFFLVLFSKQKKLVKKR